MHLPRDDPGETVGFFDTRNVRVCVRVRVEVGRDTVDGKRERTRDRAKDWGASERVDKEGKGERSRCGSKVQKGNLAVLG